MNISLYRLISIWIFLSGFVISQNVISLSNSIGWISDTIPLSISIANTDTIVAFQADIILPPNFQIITSSARLSQRANGHYLSLNRIDTNKFRIIVFSLNQSAFSGNSGEVFAIDAILPDQAGVYPFNIENAILSNPNSINVLTNAENGTVTVRENIVPVEVVLFNAILVDKGVLLRWSSTSELNNCFYEIKRFILGDEGEIIDVIAGAGTSCINTDYEILDRIDPKIYSMLTYRLTQIDCDGTRKLAGEVLVYPDGDMNQTRVYQNFPNPANPGTSIIFYSPSVEEFVFKIVSLEGAEVYSFSGVSKAGYNNLQWDGNDVFGRYLASGIYIYSITIKEKSFTNKLILLK